MTSQPADRTNGDGDTDVKTSAERADTPATATPTASEQRVAPNAVDVVTGPVGSARLKDPATSRGSTNDISTD